MMRGYQRAILPVVAVIVLAVTVLSISLVIGFASGYMLGLLFILAGLWVAVIYPSVHGATIGACFEVLGFVFCLIPAVLAFSSGIFGGLL